MPRTRGYDYKALAKQYERLGSIDAVMAETRASRGTVARALREEGAPVRKIRRKGSVLTRHPAQAPSDAIVCPQQIGLTQACATCALCWQTDRRIAFIQH